MRYLDLHADTLTELTSGTLLRNQNDVDLERVALNFSDYIQVFAIWKKRIDMQDVEQEFMELYRRAIGLLTDAEAQIQLCRTAEELDRALQAKKQAAFLSVEDLSIMGRLVGSCRELGFSFAIPTWNYENEYAYGAVADQRRGLKELGKRTLKQLLDQGVLLDVSHLSDAGIEDLLLLTDQPILASHSNVRDLCDHPRNLQRGHIREIIARGGLIGINLYRPFLGTGDSVALDQILRHMDYILNMGGEDSLCFGCDWDGCGGSFPDGIQGVQSMGKLYEAMKEAGYSPALIRKIFSENGYRFLKQNL